MKVVMSINADIKDFSPGNISLSPYNASFELYQHFANRGHDVSFVSPSEVVGSSGAIFQKEYKIKNGEVICVGSNVAPKGDVFFMRGFGQDAKSVDVTKRFFDAMGQMENRFGFMANSPETAWYDLKNYQKKLDVPFIPSPRIKSLSDLEKSLNDGKRIVAKPHSGFYGKGLLFLDNASEARKCFRDLSFEGYSFEYGVYGDEPGYFFLDGEPILKKVLRKPHVFGVQESIGLEVGDIYENSEELKVAREIIEKTGAFYGRVDFKGQGPNGEVQVLEYNGSGSSQVGYLDPSNRSLGTYFDFGERLVKEVEKKVS